MNEIQRAGISCPAAVGRSNEIITERRESSCYIHCAFPVHTCGQGIIGNTLSCLFFMSSHKIFYSKILVL